MTKQARSPDRAVLVTLAALVLIGSVATIVWHYYHRADNSYTAMARGQYKLASRYYKDEVDAGSAQAMNHLGNLHYLGLGIERDYSSAAQLYWDASSRGFAAAQLNLGHLYRQGLGVPQDAVRAFSWYAMSDIHGSPWAEKYLRQTAVEFTLSPLQISTAQETWPTLSALLKEGL